MNSNDGLPASGLGAANERRHRRALLLYNPNSRTGSQSLQPVVAQLTSAGCDIVTEPFGGDRAACDLIIQHQGNIDHVIVAGGDGTLNAVAKGLIETGLPLGIIPTGTANDLARTLNIPPDPLEAAAIIAHGHTRIIDLGEVNGRPFFNVASIGLSADLAAGLTDTLKRRFGRLGYALAALYVLVRARPFHARIATDEETVRVRTYQIAIGNGCFYGGGNMVQAKAAIDDERLDLYSLEPASVWKLAFMFRAFRRGLHGAWTEVRTARGTDFVIATRLPKPVNADGELITETPAHFTLRPAAIRVIAPAA